MADIAIARYDANTGWLPPICPKHGRPATGHRRRSFENKTPRWIGLTVLAGFLVYYLIRSKHLHTDELLLPACPECTGYLKTLRRVRLALGFGSLPLMVVALAANNIVLIMLWLLTATAWLLSLMSSFSAHNDVRGWLDGPWLRLTGVHPAFVAALRPNPAWQQVQYAPQPPAR